MRVSCFDYAAVRLWQTLRQLDATRTGMAFVDRRWSVLD